MKISLIIAVYKRSDFLVMVLESIRRQSFGDFEVIVAEDGSDSEIADVVLAFQRKAKVPVRHFTQEDHGFRKARILNRAVAKAQGEFLVFIDGDCILHPHFLHEYVKRVHDDVCLFGRRVMLGKRITQSLIQQGEAYKIDLCRVFVYRNRKKEEAVYLPFLVTRRKSGMIGCSFCVSREKMRAINGFDEDFKYPFYGEDTDIERRLRLIGVRFRCTRYKTIQYHLYHDSGDRSRAWGISEDLFFNKAREKTAWCTNGIVKSGRVAV